nr:DUF1186 domain-containing protein [Paenibacillus ginsengihumi]
MQALLESIRYNEGKFPRKELQQLIDNKEEAIPHLLAIVEEVINHPDAYLDEPSRIDLIYSLYLLAQFRETRLYPLLIQFLNLPEADMDAFLGDVVTEGVGRILASVYSDDITPVQKIIENEELDEFIRGQGLHALSILVLHGRLEREWVIDYFRGLLEEKCSEEYPTFNAQIISSLADLYGQEAYDVMKRAYEKQLVDTMMIELDDVERILKMPMDVVLENHRKDHHFQFVEDTIKELEWWACFEQERKKPPLLSKVWTNKDNIYPKPTNPAIKVEKIGRNDPCTCGSGKKYKKCCGK